jgi:ATP-dependent Lon protease
MLHPGDEPTPEQFSEYLEYAIEGRRRVKEQLNKRKPDDEFAAINLSYLDTNGKQVIVYCQESRNAAATQQPRRRTLDGEQKPADTTPAETAPAPMPSEAVEPVHVEAPAAQRAKERHYRIHYGATGFAYDTIFGDYLPGAEEIVVEDPYIRAHHQIVNFLRFCETAVRIGKPKKITLITKFDNQLEKDEALAKLYTIADSLKQSDITLVIKENAALHDREVRLSNGWSVKIGRGFDIYQRPDDWLQIGANDLALRPCLETNVDIVKV